MQRALGTVIAALLTVGCTAASRPLSSDPGPVTPFGGGGPSAAGGAPGTAGAPALAGTAGAGGTVATPAGGASGLGGAPPDTSVPVVCPESAAPSPTPETGVPSSCPAPMVLRDDTVMAPAGAGQPYQRCGSAGPDTGWSVKLSPDGKRLAALTAAGTVHLLSTSDWHEIAHIASSVGDLDGMAFSPDGTTLATLAGELGQVALWSATDGCLLRGSPITPTPVQPGDDPIAFSADGRQLVVTPGSIVTPESIPVRVLDLGRPAQFVAPPVNPPLPVNYSVAPFRLSFVAGGTKILLYDREPAGNAGFETNLRLLDAGNPSVDTELAGGLHTDVVSAAVSGDGRWIAAATAPYDSASSQAGLSLYDLTTGAQAGGAAAGSVQVIGFSPTADGVYTAAGGQLQVRELPGLGVRASWPLPDGMAPVAVTPSGTVLVSSTMASAWIDPNSGSVLRRASFPITKPSFSADGRYGAAAGDTGALFHFWREDDGTQLCAPPPPTEPSVQGAATSRDGQTLALARGDGSVELHPLGADGRIGPPRASVAVEAGAILIAVSDDGGRVAELVGSSDPKGGTQGTALVVDVARGTRLFSATADIFLPSLALSRDGGWFAYKPTATTVQAVAVDTGTVVSIPVADDQQGIIGFSDDGQTLAVESASGAQVWRMSDGGLQATYGIAESAAYGVGLSGDGSLVAASGYTPAGTFGVFVWQTAAGPAAGMRSLQSPADFAEPPFFDPSNAVLAGLIVAGHSLSVDADLYAWSVWDVSTGAYLRGFNIWTPGMVVPAAGGQRIWTVTGAGLTAWCR